MTWIVREYLCDACARRFESFEARGVEVSTRPCPSCQAPAPCVISAASVKIPAFQGVVTGKSDPRPPGMLDTSAIADGMSVGEWRGRRRKQRADRRRAKIRQMIS